MLSDFEQCQIMRLLHDGNNLRDGHESRAIRRFKLIHSLTYLFRMHTAVGQLTARVRQIRIMIKLIGDFERNHELVHN